MFWFNKKKFMSVEYIRKDQHANRSQGVQWYSDPSQILLGYLSFLDQLTYERGH